MRRGRLLKSIGLCVGLATGTVAAQQPADLTALFGQPPAPPTTPPATPPVRPTPPPTPPPTAAPPGAASQPTLAPVTGTFGTAPQSLSSSGVGFTPYMMGDLPATSYICGMVCFPAVKVVNIPPVVVTRQVVTQPSLPVGDSTGVLPPKQVSIQTIVVSPGRTIIQPTTECRFLLVPQVARGAVKIEENESPRPIDRAYVTYNYFNDIAKAFPGLPGTDLHRETYGFELTFLGGDASVGVRMNTLQTTGGSTLNGSDFGDVTVITKYALVNNAATGNVLAVGLAVSAPTGPDAILPDGRRINPVLIQPFAGSIYNMSNVYVQGFSSLIVPTDNHDVLLATSSLGLGWWMYRSDDPGAMLSYVTPFVEGHSTFALNHRGLDRSVTAVCNLNQQLAGFPDTFVLTNGVHLGLGQRSNLAIGIGLPLTGPKLFDVEAVAQLNWRF